MLNKDLIEKLKEYNPDADVSLVDSEDITISYHDDGYTALDTPQLFIEGIDLVSCINQYIYKGENMCSFYDRPCKLVSECSKYKEYIEE